MSAVKTCARITEKLIEMMKPSDDPEATEPQYQPITTSIPPQGENWHFWVWSLVNYHIYGYRLNAKL